MSESTEQQALVQWFRMQYPQYRLIAIPNGQIIGGKNKFALIKKYKAEGLTNGISDLLLCVSRDGYHGLWIEMKDRGKTEKSLTDDQVEWGEDMEKEGYRFEWAAGFDQGRDIIEAYLKE